MAITFGDHLIDIGYHDITPEQEREIEDANALKCLRCETSEAVEMRPSYTAYHWNGEGQNPNADVPLCPACFEEHREYWNEMWSYARGGY
jgi:hypothetical protein